MRRLLALATLCIGLLVPALPTASAAETGAVRVREVTLAPSGASSILVSLTGAAAGASVGAESFSVTENGRSVGRLQIDTVGEAGADAVSLALLIDVSGSMQGQPFVDAIAAASRFVATLPPSARVALIAFGSSSEVVVGLTSDRQALQQGLGSLSVRGNTSLNDAIVMAAGMLEPQKGPRSIVVFSDGRDTSSSASAAQAVEAATQAQAPLTVVGLLTADYDAAATQALAAETGGHTLDVGQSGALEAAFQQVAREIASQYVLSYQASEQGGGELDVAVALRVPGEVFTDSVVVLNPRTQLAAPSASGAAPRLVLSSPIWLYAAVAGSFAAFTLLFSVLAPARPGRSGRLLSHALATTARPRRSASEAGKAAVNSLLRRHEPGGSEKSRRQLAQSFEQSVSFRLEVAGWPLRATEFLVFQAAAAAAGGFIGAILADGYLFAGILAGAGWFLPRVLLARSMTRRSSMFISQLPDTLQLLAASLEAGYGVLQGIDSVVKESAAPTSTEFSRSLSEIRLGVPVEQALTSMSERIGGEDFKWVVTAINIQREVGGNLATVLKTVSETLRERDQLRRQVKVLSAEGRISAVILAGLPFALTAYMAFANPSYLNLLTSSPSGRLMAVVALLLMGIGGLWMRKLVRIKV